MYNQEKVIYPSEVFLCFPATKNFSLLALLVECEEFYRRVCVYCSPTKATALSLLSTTTEVTLLSKSLALENAHRMRYIPTGIFQLDKHLRGGLRVGTITEFVGKSGTAKTQMAMQIAVNAAAYRQGTIYLDTEMKLSVFRLKEISENRNTSKQSSICMAGDNLDIISTLNSESCHNILENIIIHEPKSTSELQSALEILDDEILQRSRTCTTINEDNPTQFPIRVLVIDSIAAPTRRDFGPGSATERALTVMRIAQTLKRLADQYHLAVIVINQFGTDDTTQFTTAALGTSWHHCVTTRIQFGFSEQEMNQPSKSDNIYVPGMGYRQLVVCKSNITSQSPPIPFNVAKHGLD